MDTEERKGLCVEDKNSSELSNGLKLSAKSLVSGSQRNVREAPEWFAMSATFGRALKAKQTLESHSVRCFVPMKYAIVNDPRQGKVRRLVPAISNLIFVYTTRSIIQDLKSTMRWLQYLTSHEDGRNVPIIVPEYQMQQFMAVCETHDERLVYLAPDEVNLDEGTPVRIVGTPFDGVEGTFIRVEKSRKNRVVVLVQGVAAVMITELTDGYIQVLD